MNKIFLFLIIVIFATLTRLVPHPANFTPVISIALLSGIYFKKHKYGFFLILSMSII